MWVKTDNVGNVQFFFPGNLLLLLPCSTRFMSVLNAFHSLIFFTLISLVLSLLVFINFKLIEVESFSLGTRAKNRDDCRNCVIKLHTLSHFDFDILFKWTKYGQRDQTLAFEGISIASSILHADFHVAFRHAGALLSSEMSNSVLTFTA